MWKKLKTSYTLEEKFANHIANEGLVCSMYKISPKLNVR
jgi:hypothetical protein